MDKKYIYECLLNIIDKEDIKLDEPMKKHISFRVGGPADILVKPRTEEQLSKVIRLLKEENVPYIVGMAKAAEIATDSLKYELNEVKRLRDKLETSILKNIYNSRLNTGVANRVPNTTNIGFEYVEGELILLHMSDLGICASSGSACTSGSLEPSHVLRAMNVPFTAIHGSIRFSLSRFTTEEEIDYVCEQMPKIIEKISAISPYQDELAALKALKQI